jgi:hypothetical protein
MRRWILVVLAVAVLSALIARAERVRSAEQNANAGGADWVRTADGWEPRAALTAKPLSRPLTLHPALVAAFQMGASLLVLLAFPGQAVPLSSTACEGQRRPRRGPAVNTVSDAATTSVSR